MQLLLGSPPAQIAPLDTTTQQSTAHLAHMRAPLENTLQVLELMAAQPALLENTNLAVPAPHASSVPLEHTVLLQQQRVYLALLDHTTQLQKLTVA